MKRLPFMHHARYWQEQDWLYGLPLALATTGAYLNQVAINSLGHSCKEACVDGYVESCVGTKSLLLCTPPDVVRCMRGAVELLCVQQR